MEQNKNNNLRDWSWEKEQCKKNSINERAEAGSFRRDSEKIL